MYQESTEAMLHPGVNDFQLLVSSVNEYAIFMLDKEGCVSSWNSGAENIKGYTQAEIIGKPIDIFYTPEELQNDEPKRNLALALKNGHFETEGWRVRKDRSVFFANIVFTALFDKHGEFCGYAKVTKDISAQKKAEEALMAINAEMEAFNYSISHDLRAPLRGILGFTTILKEEYGSRLDDEAGRIMGIILRNTLKMGCMLDDLLAFSRMGRQELFRTTINSNAMVKDVIADLPFSVWPANIRWELEDLPSVRADPATLRQVWANLISNAVKYSGKREVPHIRIGYLEEQMVFFVRDNGVGFNNKYKDKLFKVFQRLHSADQFEGTGVGLALAAKIICRHGGKMWAEGKEDEGACFYFALPQVSQAL